MPDFSDLLGKPFESCARGPESFDCWGAVVAGAARYGRTMPDYPRYHSRDLDLIRAEFKQRKDDWEFIPFGESPAPCDVIVFKSYGGLHFALVIEGGMFLECTRDLGVHLGRLDNPAYRQLITGFYRLKNDR